MEESLLLRGSCLLLSSPVPARGMSMLLRLRWRLPSRVGEADPCPLLTMMPGERRSWSWRGDSVKHVEKESLNLQGDVRATFRGIKIICRWRVDTHFWLFFVSYLHTDNTSPTTAVLAFINCLIATAQGIESQYSSHAVPNEAYLERKRVRRKVNKTNHPSSSPSKTHMQLLQDSSAVETRWICS